MKDWKQRGRRKAKLLSKHFSLLGLEVVVLDAQFGHGQEQALEGRVSSSWVENQISLCSEEDFHPAVIPSGDRSSSDVSVDIRSHSPKRSSILLPVAGLYARNMSICTVL